MYAVFLRSQEQGAIKRQAAVTRTRCVRHQHHLSVLGNLWERRLAERAYLSSDLAKREKHAHTSHYLQLSGMRPPLSRPAFDQPSRSQMLPVMQRTKPTVQQQQHQSMAWPLGVHARWHALANRVHTRAGGS